MKIIKQVWARFGDLWNLIAHSWITPGVWLAIGLIYGAAGFYFAMATALTMGSLTLIADLRTTREQSSNRDCDA